MQQSLMTTLIIILLLRRTSDGREGPENEQLGCTIVLAILYYYIYSVNMILQVPRYIRINNIINIARHNYYCCYNTLLVLIYYIQSSNRAQLLFSFPIFINLCDYFMLTNFIFFLYFSLTKTKIKYVCVYLYQIYYNNYNYYYVYPPIIIFFNYLFYSTVLITDIILKSIFLFYHFIETHVPNILCLLEN